MGLGEGEVEGIESGWSYKKFLGLPVAITRNFQLWLGGTRPYAHQSSVGGNNHNLVPPEL